jgi:hypothetical protein
MKISHDRVLYLWEKIKSIIFEDELNSKSDEHFPKLG